jgi:hypothetical protein
MGAIRALAVTGGTAESHEVTEVEAFPAHNDTLA